MGYAITRQKPWGAVEAILVGPPEAGAAPSGGATPGDDFVRGGGVKPGVLYGVNDARRAAGAAIGY
jgi:gamma-glutamyltranspeptidase/glutathione hydrolase